MKFGTIIILINAFNFLNAFSSGSKRSFMNMSTQFPKPRGSAASPIEKQKVAVFGAGGYLGSTVFGFLQRASSLYGTGLGGFSSPRCIGATAGSIESLNKNIMRSFKLAFAGEDLIRLTNMQDVESIKQSLNGMDAAILGTVNKLQTKNAPFTYSRTPNDKTYEMFFDDKFAIDEDVPYDDDKHLILFRNSIEACEKAGLKHVVVVETPSTVDPKDFITILDEANIHFTYIHSTGPMENIKFFTFEEGIQSDLNIKGLVLKNGYGQNNARDWAIPILRDRKSSNSNECVPREDIAAVIVQSLMSLDWERSRYLEISSKGKLASALASLEDNGPYMPKRKTKMIKSDRKWCMNSELLEENFAFLE